MNEREELRARIEKIRRELTHQSLLIDQASRAFEQQSTLLGQISNRRAFAEREADIIFQKIEGAQIHE